MIDVEKVQLKISLPGKRACFWGAPAHAVTSGTMSAKLAATGANTGNLFIGHGLFHGLDCARKAFHPGFGTIPAERLHEHFDLVVIPASNFVGNGVDLTDHADYFARSKVPLFCFGLGSQVLPGQEVALKPGTERFLRLLSERGGSVGVRGAFTAGVLWDMGIRNVSITGCPSLLNLRPSTVTKLVAGRPSLDKIAVNFSNNVRRHSVAAAGMRASENALFQRMLAENAFYILQNEAPEMALVDALNRGDSDAAAVALPRVAELFDVSGSREDVRRFLEQRMRVFFSVEDWVGCMATMSASLGTRFHGNVAALLAGTPALFLVHDMRTLELCELLSVPHLLLDRAVPAEELMERLLAADYRPFARQFARLMAEWRLFLHRNGLDSELVTEEAGAAEQPELALTA
jgi:polysaccharide pyruvyl transferase